MLKLAQGCVAEFLGTFALVFFGAGSIVLTSIAPDSGANLLTVALAHGIALAVFITGAVHISGGQFNPAVSVGLVVAGKQPGKIALAYIVSQLIAAASGAGMLVALLGAEVANSSALPGATGGTDVGATIGSLTEPATLGALFGLEAIMSFALVWTVLRCVVDDRAHKLGGLMVGLVVMMCILTAGPLTGASMNPARSLGPALYGHWDMHWVYWAAPMTGGIFAGLLDRFFATAPAGGA